MSRNLKTQKIHSPLTLTLTNERP